MTAYIYISLMSYWAKR